MEILIFVIILVLVFGEFGEIKTRIMTKTKKTAAVTTKFQLMRKPWWERPNPRKSPHQNDGDLGERKRMALPWRQEPDCASDHASQA